MSTFSKVTLGIIVAAGALALVSDGAYGWAAGWTAFGVGLYFIGQYR
jgi:hypothetical protein